MPSVSLNEIDGYGRRAARGAGMPWGLAEETGRATRWLCERGLPAARSLAALLACNDGLEYTALAPDTGSSPWRAAGGRLCPICTGATLADRAASLPTLTPLQLARTTLPVFLLPFLAQAAAATGTGFELSWCGVRVRVGPGTLQLLQSDDDALLVVDTAEVVINTCDAPDEAAQPPSGAVNVDAATWASLTSFAHRTYVPASETSRERGAGAGGSDND